VAASLPLLSVLLCAAWRPNDPMTHHRPDFLFRQMGLGTPGGCEVAVHTTRRFLEKLASDHVVVKLDFSSGDML